MGERRDRANVDGELVEEVMVELEGLKGFASNVGKIAELVEAHIEGMEASQLGNSGC